MKVIAVTPFLNELKLLKIRLEVLAGVVDCHVITEAPVTFSGINKPLYFNENKHRFAQYPIDHLIIDDMPMGQDPWVREHHQTHRVLDAVTKHQPDIVIWTDLDEIPRADVVERFITMDVPVASLRMDMLLFYPDCHAPHISWDYAKIAKFDGKIPYRNQPDLPVIEDAGWHFEYMGGRETLLEKVNATSHAIDPGGRDFWQRVYRGEKPGIEDTVPYPDEKLPLMAVTMF